MPLHSIMTDDLIKSDFTSIQQRLFDHAKRKQHQSRDEKTLVARVKKQRQLMADLELDEQPEAKLMAFRTHHSVRPELVEGFLHSGVGMLRQAQHERNKKNSAVQHERENRLHRNSIHDALPMTQDDYFELVDTTGRCIRDDKPG